MVEAQQLQHLEPGEDMLELDHGAALAVVEAAARGGVVEEGELRPERLLVAIEDDGGHPLLRGEVADDVSPLLAVDGVPGDEGADLGAEAQGMLVESLRDELLADAERRVDENVPPPWPRLE